MDWFSWLSKTGLEPSLVSEYALAFGHNELEEDDIAYFNNEFLQSMGISIAKHRLEILKLARKEKGGSSHLMSRLIVAIKQTKRRAVKYIQKWVHYEDLALVHVQKRSYGLRWTKARIKRNNKLMTAKEERLMLTNQSPMVAPSPWLNSFSSPMVDHLPNNKNSDGIDGVYRSTGPEEIRWDTMFQDLKPT
ncbi:unnamed protein product [Ilex paraguariensis]|uniref:SAM domain-containing protein n=1 Tax=Ilex paraguariensis TaxID=185542 RepID=A0ABC8RZ37_9AQUA